jgi:hypothetical protein
MPSTAISAQGSTLKIDIAVAGTPDTLIGNLYQYSGFDGEASEIDISNLYSVAKEFLLGLKDNGGFTVEYHPDYDDNGHNDLRAAEVSSKKKTLLLTLPNGKEITFDAFVKNANGISGGVDGVVTGGASLKITGALR